MVSKYFHPLHSLNFRQCGLLVTSESGVWAGVEGAADLSHGVAWTATVNSNVCVQLQVCFVVICIDIVCGVSNKWLKTIKIYGHSEPNQKLLLWSPRCHIFGRRCKIIITLRKKKILPECFWIFQSLVTYVLLNKWLCSRNQGDGLFSPCFRNSDVFLPLPRPCPKSTNLDCPLKGRSVLWVVTTMCGLKGFYAQHFLPSF